jgi:peptidyl-dipeptidase Dcp
MSTSAINLNNVCLDNPLLHTFSKDYGIPPFAEITASHYKGAFETAFVEHEAELKAIVDNKEVSSFENTLLAFDRSGSLLTKVGKVYYNLCSSMCPPGMNSPYDFLRAYSVHDLQLKFLSTNPSILAY